MSAASRAWSQPMMSRRSLLAASGAVSMTGAGGASAAPSAAPFSIVDLKVESLVQPLGLDTPRPYLGWRLVSDRPGTVQSAYRIGAASSADKLSRGEFDLWDTGRVACGDSLGHRYDGRPLGSRAKVHWQVEAWDDHGGHAAARSTWEMGLSAADWTAQWIAAEAEQDRLDRLAGFDWLWSGEAHPGKPRKFRFAFDLSHAAQGVLLAGGVDRLQGLWIDGRPVPVLAPGPNDFAKPPLTEVRVQLTRGRHVVAGEVRVDKGVLPAASGAFGALLRLVLADGVRLWISPKDRCRTSLEEVADWFSPGFDDKGWPLATVLADPPSTPWPARPAVLMRKAFEASGAVVSARLYVAALGGFQARLNGERIDDGLLAPGYTDYRARTPYRTYDVTRLVKTGSNALGFWVADGWFASVAAPASRFAFGPAPRRLLAQLEITYADGRRQTVISDPSWKVRDSAVLAAEIYNGETYDARREVAGWDRPGLTDGDWEPAALAPKPATAPTADILPPVRVTQVLEPVKRVDISPDVAVFDFGQNFAGVPQIALQGPAGAAVAMTFAEVLSADGRADQSNLRAARAADHYICAGRPQGETYQPAFTFHGFRYVEVSGLSRLERFALKAGVIHNDLPLTASVSIKDRTIAGVWRNALWSQRSNFLGVPTDCPQRDERLGWTGDAQVFWDAAAFNMDVELFTRRFMEEMRIAQDSLGGFPVFAPAAVRPPAAIGPTPGWADAGVILPWTTWRRSGSTAVIDENWQAMERYLAAIAKTNPEGLWRNKRGINFGDWLSLDAKAAWDETTPKDLIATAYWAHDCALMADMAAATGRKDDAARFEADHERIAEAFRKAFVAQDGQIGNASQTSYILPLRFGLLTPDQRKAAGARLAASIRERGSLTTGFLGTPNILDALADSGHGDVAMSLLQSQTYPSWGYMMSKGATSMWERWNSDTGDVAMNSFNHYALGAVSGFIMRRLVGIDALEPGFRRILFRPLILAASRQAAGKYMSPMGLIQSDWSLSPAGQLRLALQVPANASAQLVLPKGAYKAAGERLAAPTALTGHDAQDVLVFELAAGSHTLSGKIDGLGA
jgi:alpha-L-rhamnosidase